LHVTTWTSQPDYRLLRLNHPRQRLPGAFAGLLGVVEVLFCTVAGGGNVSVPVVSEEEHVANGMFGVSDW
jgi:hypothetical protein